jgi:signal transduction histidine kinase
MSSPDVPVGTEPADNGTVPRAHVRVGLPRPPRFSLTNWSVSWRLIVVIVIAMVIGLVFGGLRVSAAADAATAFARTTQVAVLGEEVTALAQAMENERDLTAALCAASPGGNCPSTGEKLDQTARSLQAEVQRAQTATDAVAGQVQTLAAQIGSPFPASTQTKAAAVITVIDHLGGANTAGVRTEVVGQPAQSVIEAYTEAIADLFVLNDEITSSSSDAVLSDEVRTLGALSRAKDEASQERAILYTALLQGSFGGTLQALTTAQGLEGADLDAFQSSDTPTEENTYLNVVSGEKVNTTQLLNGCLAMASDPKVTPAQALAEALNAVRLGSQVVSLTREPGQWYSIMTDTINRMRTVEQQVAAGIVARSQALERGARQSAELTAAVTAGVLLLVLALTIIVARSMVDPLRRLQADALEIAATQLPARVAALSEATDPNVSLDVEPISVHSTDEIGKVARAFDQVHREAVRLAGNEARLRGNLSAMFISLSRRSVPLIERLARIIDSLEQNEDDPDRLSNLFSMDHLVTRMRRNSENLLVLAGEEPVRKWGEPVPLTDVARAATSEIEQYSRVVLSIWPGIAISGQAASDVVHLLAEIIENATIFSPRDTPVHVSGREISSGGVLLEVQDSGVGVSPTRLAELNWQLDNPPLVDVSVSRHMGLFAVSRLAARHGVRVRLRAASPQGLSALVWLPGTLTGREAVRYVDPRSRHAADQAAVAQLRVGRRRGTGRHSLEKGLRAAAGAQQDSISDGYGGSVPATAAATAAGKSEWFRAKRPSGASAQAAVTGTIESTGSSLAASPDSPGDGGSASADAGADGRRTAETVAAPVRGDRTAAGLPTRVPGANLFPGSASDPAETWGAGEMPVLSRRKPNPEREETIPAQSASLPRRSPELARSRLSGFQLGSRQAEGRASEENRASEERS